jgi:hypothetical protein
LELPCYLSLREALSCSCNSFSFRHLYQKRHQLLVVGRDGLDLLGHLDEVRRLDCDKEMQLVRHDLELFLVREHLCDFDLDVVVALQSQDEPIPVAVLLTVLYRREAPDVEVWQRLCQMDYFLDAPQVVAVDVDQMFRMDYFLDAPQVVAVVEEYLKLLELPKVELLGYFFQ